MPDTRLSVRLYRWLLRLYPAGFRQNYAAPMEREFQDDLAETHGTRAVAALWMRLFVDLARSLPVQLSRELRQDARHALRLWARDPLHIAFAIAALAIGVGANTGVFSVVNALLLRSLPFQDPARLAAFNTYLVPHDSAALFHDWWRQSSFLAGAALFEQADFNLGNSENVARAHIAQTSWNFFSLLGTRPVLGRAFRPGDDTTGRNAIAVIGYGLWQQLYAGDPRVLGSTLRVNGMPLTIIGVAPPGFEYPARTVLWKAADFSPGNNGWETIARLKPGLSWPQARAAFSAEIDRLWAAGRMAPETRVIPRLVSLQDTLAGRAKNASLLLLAGVALILLIACTNIANLLLARTAARSPELAIRSALGAGRARLVQQLLTECLLLSFVASLAGLLVAYWTESVAAAVEPPPLAAQAYTILDWRVLGFALGIALLTGILFGVLPSLKAGRVHAFETRASGGLRTTLIRDLLVAAQVMLTVILLAASIGVGRAFLKLARLDRGFDPNGLVTVSVALDGTTHQAGQQLPYFEEALGRIRRLPGVRAASATEFLPLYATSFIGAPWGIDGRPAKHSSLIIPVLPDYFKAMGGRLLYGREFTDAEVRSDARVIVVSKRFAAAFGSPADILQHQVTFGNMPPRKIIGVVDGMDYMSGEMPEAIQSSQMFLPAHSPGGFFSTFVVRVNGRPEEHLAAIRDTIRSVDPRVPVFGAKTMEQRLDDSLARPKFYRTSLLFFAGFALLLAVIGIYGIVSYAVTRRTREMGIRLALGSTSVHLRGVLLAHGLLPIVAGAFAGIVGALLAARFLEFLATGATSGDFATIGSSFSFVVLTSAASIWIATRRIAALDIAETLRFE